MKPEMAEKEGIMELLELMKTRRSIRRYKTDAVEREKLDKIVEAGLYAPNPGGRQGTKIILLTDPELIEKIGIVNADCENRNWDIGVSTDQLSIIDDKTIRSGFYGCPALAMVCIKRKSARQVNGIGSAFVCAQNNVLEAYDLGVSSVIVGRAEATFANAQMQALLDQWGLDPEYIPIVFVCLGYINGAYPGVKPRYDGRVIVVE